MKNLLSRAGLATIAMACACIYGCGGSGGGSTTTPTSTTLSGTAAIGAPISGTVVAIDVNGKVSTATSTNSLGAYTVDVGGMTPPFILSVVGTANGKQVTLNSVATAAGQTVNITPLTDLIVSIASGQVAGSTLAASCTPVNNVVPASCISALKAATVTSNLNSAVSAVKAMIQPINTTNADPLNGAFVADGTGLDKVLDQILVSPAESQGAQATVTLIATNSSLGTATLPATAGQAAATSTTAPSAAELARAAAAATVLPEIRACMAALNRKYSGPALTDADVSPFVDVSFHNGAQQDKAVFLPTLKSALATPGFVIRVAGLSPANMEPLSSTEITNFIASTNVSATPVGDFVATRAALGPITFDSSTGAATAAWVQLTTNTDFSNWKLVKTSDTSGCSGGWKLAGINHMGSHMNARITRSTDYSGTVTYSRRWAFHANVDNVVAEGSTINQIDVRGAGLTTFGLFSTSGVNADSAKLRLKKPTNGVTTVFQITDRDPSGNTTPDFSAFYGTGEALQSCQDLAAAYPAPTADLSTSTVPGRWTPCVDETKVSPGKLRLWTLRSGGVEVKAFLSQVAAVPLSKAYAIANAANVFPTLTSVTPASVASLNALSGTLLDNQVTFNYTQGSAYGSKMDNCGLYVWNGSSQILSAEEDGEGKETSCTFATSTLNSVGSNANGLFKFTGTATDAYVGLTGFVLGNQATSSMPLPH